MSSYSGKTGCGCEVTVEIYLARCYCGPEDYCYCFDYSTDVEEVSIDYCDMHSGS